MARRELRRKITATVLTVTALCCLLGVCAWLLLGSNVFSDTIRIMMLVCTVVLGVATIGLLVAKVQEIRALREIIRSEDAQQQSEAETPRPELAPLQTLDHTTIELPPLPDIPAPAAQPAPKQAKQQPKTKQGRSKKRGRAMEQPAAETMAPAQPVLQPIEVVPPTPVAPPRPVQQAPQPEQPSVERKWKPIDFNAAMQIVATILEHSLLLGTTLPDTGRQPVLMRHFHQFDQILADLPRSFSYSDFTFAAQNLGISLSTAKRILKKGLEQELIVKQGDKYRKRNKRRGK